MKFRMNLGGRSSERLTVQECRADWRDVPNEERERLFKLFTEGGLLAPSAAELNMPLPTLQRHLRDWRTERLRYIDIPSVFFPDSTSRQYNDQLVVQTDNAIIISDIEIPDHDPVMLEAVLLTAMVYNIKTLVINGDFLATDNAALNSWVSTWSEGNEINYEGAVGLGVRILERFCTWFDHIIIDEGNHDDRINRATGGEVWIAMLLSEARIRAEAHDCVIEFTHYSYCYLETSRGMVLVLHPVNYSINPVGLAQQYYFTENGPYYDPADPNSRVDRCHIVMAHTHIQGWGMSRDNTREMHALGTLRDPLRTQYKSKRKSKLPNWTQGFLMIRDGYFYPLNRHTTNWAEILSGLDNQSYEIIQSQKRNQSA